jgi:hypothetical protein
MTKRRNRRKRTTVGRKRRGEGKKTRREMETVCSSETVVPVSTYKSTQRHNPEDQHRNLHSRENLESQE